MGMDDIKAAGDKFDIILRPAKNLISFINTNEGDVKILKQAFGKPLDTVTDADIKAYVGEDGAVLTKDTLDNTRKALTVLEKLITIVKPIRNELPANDIKR